jgi:type IV secretory pathway VirB4 component
MTHSDNSVAYFARTNFRNKGMPFGIKQADRFSHMYVIGKTGTGKSTLLETLAVQDLGRPGDDAH